MEHTRMTLGVGKDSSIKNRSPLAFALRIVCHGDGTTLRVVLSPGAEALITGGTGDISIHIDDADPDFSGLELVHNDSRT